jgi:5-deoxy-D-glucuronate isomerase
MNDACGICGFSVIRVYFEVFELDGICNLKDGGIVGLWFGYIPGFVVPI